MGDRNPPEKQRGYAKNYRERKKAEGLRQLVVWVRPENVERVRAYVNRLKPKQESKA